MSSNITLFRNASPLLDLGYVYINTGTGFKNDPVALHLTSYSPGNASPVLGLGYMYISKRTGLKNDPRGISSTQCEP